MVFSPINFIFGLLAGFILMFLGKKATEQAQGNNCYIDKYMLMRLNFRLRITFDAILRKVSYI